MMGNIRSHAQDHEIRKALLDYLPKKQKLPYENKEQARELLDASKKKIKQV